jgi:hypothetical protein
MDSNTCNSGKEGAMRYNNSTKLVEFCNGTAWTPFSSGGASLGYQNLRIKNNTTTPNTQIDITANYLETEGYSKTTLNTTINAATVGANGIDAGSLGASTWYYVWGIYNPTTSTMAGLLSTSSTAPTMPSGYTKKRLISMFKTNASSQLIAQSQIDDRIDYDARQQIATSLSSTSYTTQAVSSMIPSTTNLVREVLFGATGSVANWIMLSTDGVNQKTKIGTNSTNINIGEQNELFMYGETQFTPIDGNNIYYKVSSGTVTLYARSYFISLGNGGGSSAGSGSLWEQSGANIAYTSGNVGIGTTSPSSLLDLQQAGTVKANNDMLEITNSGNAADMDATTSSILFNQYYYDASTPAVADSARLTVGTEQDWTSTATTQDSYMAFSTALDGTLTERMRIDSAGNVGIGGSSTESKLYINNTFSTATAGEQYGLFVNQNYGIADTSYKQGLRVNASSTHSTGTLGSIMGTLSAAQKSNVGAVTDAYGIWTRVNNNNATGAITNAYGLYIADSAEVGTITNDYGVFQVDTGAYNYFGGRVGIGTISPPGNLSVLRSTGIAPSLTYHGGSVASFDSSVGAEMAFGVDSASPWATWIQARQSTNISWQLALNPLGGNVGINTNNPGYPLTVNGQPAANGYTAFTNYSDRRLKENIQSLGTGYLEKIMRLNPSSFNYNELSGYDEETRSRNINGFIAQELEKVFPEMIGHVQINGTDYLDTNLSALPIFLTKAIQEQQAQISGISDDQSSISNLILKTNSNVTNLQQLQNSIDTQLGVVQKSLTALVATDKDQETTMATQDTRITDLETLTATLQGQIATLQQTTNQDAIALLNKKMDAISELITVSDGNVDLLEGALTASGIETGKLVISVSDKSKNNTIGETRICPATEKVGEDGKCTADGKADTDGKKVFVENTLITEKSKIFTSFENNPGSSTWVEKESNDGTYAGFWIKMGSEVTDEKGVKVNWWIVEEK